MTQVYREELTTISVKILYIAKGCEILMNGRDSPDFVLHSMDESESGICREDIND